MSSSFSTSALFWSLLWQSTVLFGLGLLVSRSLRRRVGQAHFVLLLSLAMSLFLPVGNAVVGWKGWGLLTPAPAPVSVESATPPSSGKNVSVPPDGGIGLEDPAIPSRQDPIPIQANHAEEIGWRFEWLVWGVGGVTVLLFIRLGLNLLGGVRLLTRARPLVHERVQRLLEIAQERVGVSRTPVIFSTGKVRCPAIWCWALHPALLLPETMTRDSDRLKDADWVGIFCHELSHLKRCDHLSAIVAELACCLFWWQPLAWLSRNRLHHFSDEACDYWAVTQGQPAPDYAELLVHMAAQPRSLTALSMVGSRKRLRERVDFILKTRPGQLRLRMRWIAGALLLAVGLTTFLACIQKRREKEPEAIVTRDYKLVPDHSERVKALVEALIQSENAKNGDKQPDPKCQVTLDDSKANLRITDTISNLQKVEELLAHIGEHLDKTEDDTLTVQTFEIKRNGVPLDPKSYADSSFFKSTYEQVETLLYTERGRDASADLGWKMRPDRNKLDIVTDFKIEITDTKRRLRDVADFLKLAKAGEADTETSNPTDVSDQKTGEVLMPTRVYALNPVYSHRIKALVEALIRALTEKAGDQELDRYRQCRFQDDKMNTLLVKDTISNLQKVDEVMMNMDRYIDRKENEAPLVYTEQSPPQPWQISTGTFKVKPDSAERVKALVEALIQAENARNGNGQPDPKCRIELDDSRENLSVTDTISNIRKTEIFLAQLSEKEEKNLTSQSWRKGPFVEGVEYRVDTQVTRNGHPTLCLKKTVERYFPIAEWTRLVWWDGLDKAKQLRLSGWVRAEKAQKAILDVQFQDSKGKWRHQWAAYIGSKNQNEPPADHDWKRYEGVVDVPEGTLRVQIGLQIYGPGTVWFDEVELAPL